MCACVCSYFTQPTESLLNQSHLCPALNFVTSAPSRRTSAPGSRSSLGNGNGASTARTEADLAAGLHKHLPYFVGSLTDLCSNGLQFFQRPADKHNIESLFCQLGMGVGKPKKRVLISRQGRLALKVIEASSTWSQGDMLASPGFKCEECDKGFFVRRTNSYTGPSYT